MINIKSHGVVILGSTGSIGISALDVLARHPDSYQVLALSGWRQLNRLREQCLKHHPKFVVVESADSARYLAGQLLDAKCDTTVLHGADALLEIATLPEADSFIAAIVGAAGLPAVLAAATTGKRLLLANKEALVVAGRLLIEIAQQHNTCLLPIDSEHSAILQALPPDFEGNLANKSVEKLVLTASGGPFRTLSHEKMQAITPNDACLHPTWVMGKKISVDSATLMNKGLEVIEACWLFHAQAHQIDVVIHPESILHAMVQYQDGSALAQLGIPDMRTAIAYALSWPNRITSGVESLNLAKIATLHFEAPDFLRFPCLNLALMALKAAGDAPAILNAANEIAVEAFLNEQIGFCDIAIVVENTLHRLAYKTPTQDLSALMACDQEARIIAQQEVNKR